VAAATTRPETLGQPFTRWSLRKLAAYLAGLDRPVRVGRERLRQILHARGISFQRTRTWKESHDPDKDAKLDRIEYVTSHYPDRRFAFDQFGPLSIRPCHVACWAYRKRPARLRATYHRTDGIRYFHGCYGLGDDQLWGVVRERKGADHTLAALKSIQAARPGGYRLFVIMDNLSANKTPAIRAWARRENVKLCFTPTNASWANPIEAQFGPVRTFVMANPDYRDYPALARRLQDYLRWRNAHARHPDVAAGNPALPSAPSWPTPPVRPPPATSLMPEALPGHPGPGGRAGRVESAGPAHPRVARGPLLAAGRRRAPARRAGRGRLAARRQDAPGMRRARRWRCPAVRSQAGRRAGVRSRCTVSRRPPGLADELRGLLWAGAGGLPWSSRRREAGHRNRPRYRGRRPGLSGAACHRCSSEVK